MRHKYGAVMTGPIVVISALDAETRALVGAMGDAAPYEEAFIKGHSGSIDGREVLVVEAGLGKVATATAIGILYEAERPRVFVFSGVAGGVDPNLHIGDVVVGSRTIQHDAGVIEPGGLHRYQAGHIPFFNPTDELGYSPSEALLDRIRPLVGAIELNRVLDRDPRVVFGTILTGDQYLHDGATRQKLHVELGAAAIEMEGGALAQAAGLVGTDHLIVRSLSDLAGADSISDFGRFVGEVAVNSALVVRALLPVL